MKERDELSAGITLLDIALKKTKFEFDETIQKFKNATIKNKKTEPENRVLKERISKLEKQLELEKNKNEELQKENNAPSIKMKNTFF